MADLRSILDEAAREGLISAEAGTRLAPFLVARGVVVEARAGSIAASAWSDTETPRFVRGFHDVLITIGILIALAGLWGLASLYAVLPAILVLAEILVKRQRLALPAVVLTLAAFAWTFRMMLSIYPWNADLWLTGDGIDGFIVAFPVVMGLFYLRYRVPLAFALTIFSGLALVLALVFRLLQWVSGDDAFILNHPTLVSVILFACAVGLFLAALGFDLSDRFRRTTRSDVAFWLHLVAAPALLYSIRILLSLDGGWLDIMDANSFKTPVVVAIVALLMLIGLIIDRRAFVTSGLLTLGLAIYGIFRQGSATVDTYIFGTLVVVGVIVLVIGTGWMPLRRMVLRAFPSGIVERLPPG